MLTKISFTKAKEALVTSSCHKRHIISSCLVLKGLRDLSTDRNASEEADMTTSKSEIASEQQPRQVKCVICGKPTERLVDGEPSCDYHANQVYERQLEDDSKKHLN